MSQSATSPRIFIGPTSDELIESSARKAGAEIVDDAADADCLVWLSPLIPELKASLHPGIRWVQLKAAGIDNVLRSGVVDDARVWTSARGAYAEEVAEHGLTLMLAASRRLHDIIPDHTWGEPGTRFGRVFAGSKVTIIGCGGIGEALIRQMAPFGVQVTAVTRSGRSVPGADVSLNAAQGDEAFEGANFVVLTAPSTPATQGYMDHRRLAVMEKSAWLVNIGRGDLVVTDDLVEALKAESLAGAALDVTDPEPLPDDHPLWEFTNVIITPHTANPPDANSRTLAARVAENLNRLMKGQVLIGVIDPHQGY